MCVRVRASAHVCAQVRACACVRACMCVDVRAFVRACVCVRLCGRVRAHPPPPTRTRARTL